MANKKTRKRWTGYSVYEDDQGFGRATGRVLKDVKDHLKENPLDITWLAGGAGAARWAGAKALGKLKTKAPEWSKKIREKYGEKASKQKFTSTKDKSAKQRAEEKKGKHERVVTEKKTKVDKRFKKPRKTTYTEAGYEPTWGSILHAQKGKAFWGSVGVGIGAATYKKVKAKGETTVGAATYEDKTTDSNLQKSNTTTKKRELEGRGMLKSSANTTKPKMDRKVVDGGINWATGGKLNGRAATDPNATNRSRYVPRQEGGELQDWTKPHAPKMINEEGNKAANKYKSVTSNYTRKKDHRGTRVERDTPRANVSGTNKRYSPTVSATKVNGNKKTRKMHLSERFRRSLGGR